MRVAAAVATPANDVRVECGLEDLAAEAGRLELRGPDDDFAVLSLEFSDGRRFRTRPFPFGSMEEALLKWEVAGEGI